MDNFNFELGELEGIVTPQGEIAWKAENIPNIVEIARKYNRIILGGDVLTVSGEYTYDNWFYNRDGNVSKQTNVEQSIDKCLQYIGNYLQRNGSEFLFVMVFA